MVLSVTTVQTVLSEYNNTYTHIRTPLLTNFLVFNYIIYTLLFINPIQIVQLLQFILYSISERNIFCTSFCTFCKL